MIYPAHDEKHNSAIVVRACIQERIRSYLERLNALDWTTAAFTRRHALVRYLQAIELHVDVDAYRGVSRKAPDRAEFGALVRETQLNRS